jgi:hypothetical protein
LRHILATARSDIADLRRGSGGSTAPETQEEVDYQYERHGPKSHIKAPRLQRGQLALHQRVVEE